jgi:hypothetical protein
MWEVELLYVRGRTTVCPKQGCNATIRYRAGRVRVSVGRTRLAIESLEVQDLGSHHRHRPPHRAAPFDLGSGSKWSWWWWDIHAGRLIIMPFALFESRCYLWWSISKVKKFKRCPWKKKPEVAHRVSDGFLRQNGYLKRSSEMSFVWYIPSEVVG